MNTARPVPAATSPVRRRTVFYIPGYDPFPPRRYRELYRSEARAQAQISGYEITLSAAGGQPSGWDVAAQISGQQTRTRVEVLLWSDLVQSSMSHSIAMTYLQMIRTAWTYISSGALGRLMRLRKGPVIAALYPVVFLLAQLALACLAGWGAARAAGLVTGAAPLQWVAAAVTAFACLKFFQRYDRKVFAYYLMHDYAFTAQDRGAYPPALDARLAAFRDRIKAALAEDVDEVLIVGHSSGAHLAVSSLAALIASGLQPGSPALSLLTLGQVVPMVSFLPKASRLRADLHLLAASEAVTWVDVSAPGDGCCFALCDPVGVTGIAPEPQTGPLVVSAAFSQTLSAERYAALKRRYFRLHFQYLCAFDRPGDYDYFQITAGPLTLADRFRGRAPSKSRITHPVSGFTDMDPPQ